MSIEFGKYRAASQAVLTREERESWRKQFASAVVAFTQTVSSREALLEALHNVLPHLGMPEGLVRLGSGSTRSTFALPFGLVMKLEIDPHCFAVTDGWLMEHGFQRQESGNFVEVERAKRLPNFVPRTYGQCLRFFDRAEETINLVISERLIPLHRWLNAVSGAVLTPLEEFAVNPDTGQVMLMDAGGEWQAGAENALANGLEVKGLASTDGRIKNEILLGIGECLFGQFRAQAIGARYGTNFEELRQVFADHLLRFAGVCSDADTLRRYLPEFMRADGIPFPDEPLFSGQDASAYRLPFDLVMILARSRGRIIAPQQSTVYGSLHGSAKRNLPDEVIFENQIPVPERDNPLCRGAADVSAINRQRRSKVTAARRGALSVMIVENSDRFPTVAAKSSCCKCASGLIFLDTPRTFPEIDRPRKSLLMYASACSR